MKDMYKPLAFGKTSEITVEFDKNNYHDIVREVYNDIRVKLLSSDPILNKILKQILLFYFIVVISLLYSMFFMFVFVDLLFLNKMLSRILTTFIILILNYFLHSRLTFNKRFFNY